MASTYSARSRFWPPFFPDEDGTGSDAVPSLDACQSPGDQRQDPPSDGLEDDVAIASIPDANVGQCRSLHPITALGMRGMCVCGEGKSEAEALLYVGVYKDRR